MEEDFLMRFILCLKSVVARDCGGRGPQITIIIAMLHLFFFYYITAPHTIEFKTCFGGQFLEMVFGGDIRWPSSGWTFESLIYGNDL